MAHHYRLTIVSLCSVWLLVLGLWLSLVPASHAEIRSLNDEIYACGTVGMSFDELASAGVTVLSHAPWGGGGLTLEQAKTFIDQAHRHGIRVLPYVSLYKVIDSREVKDSYHTRQHPFWKEVDLLDHPEWALIDENGRIRRPFDAPGYRAGVHQSCTNVGGIADAYVRGVRNLMGLGADGVFVDNVHPHPVCFGPRFGKHEHLYDKDNVYTYHLALKRVYEAVKEVGAEKVVILNTGSGPRREFDDCGDGTMLESYICAFTPEADRRRWHDWKLIMQWAGQHKDYIGAGKAVVALSYLGHTVEPVKDDLFYSAACGRLSGFLWTGDVWSGSFIPEIRDRPGNDILRSLWRARLGAALTGLEQQENITYRLFEKGLVVVNPHSTPRTVDLPVPSGFAELSDLYMGIGQPIHDGRLSVVIPPESGRFYVEPDIAFRSSLAECVLAAKGVAQRLNQLRAPTDVKDWVLLDATHQGGQGSIVVDRTQARSGRASLRITSEGSGGQGYARSLGMMLLQKEPAPVTVSYWAKVAPDSRAAAKLTFDVDCQDGSNTSWSPPDVTEYEWTHRQATYVPPKAIHDLKVLCAASYDQPGTVWFDDVVVTVGAEPANQVRNPGFEENENTMSDQALDRVQAWMDRNSPGLEQIQARYRVIPSEADQAGFVRELASRQLTVSPLLEEKLDEVIRRRLDHVREYAGRALAAATDITLQIGAPRQAVPGERLAVELFCSNRSRHPIENVQFDLEGPAGWVVGPESHVRRNPLEPGSSVRLPLTVSVPSTAQTGTPVLFTAVASFTRGPSYEGQHPEISVVQTHGLRVERSASPATAPAALPLEEQRNRRVDSSAKRIAPASQGSTLSLRLRRRIEVEKGSGQYRLAATTEHWEPRETAIIICDMWDRHWCKGATRRIVEMAPRINQVITEAHARGVLIIHAPSRTMDFYEQTPQRRLAREAPVARPPVPLRQWCPLDAGREPPLPIDDSDGGCDCQPPCKQDSQRRRQIDTIKIGEGDAVTDSLEAFYLLEQRGIKNVILLGVHANMCVLGRSFGIRQMVYQGKNVVLMRDLTDTMYNSRQRPFVSHFAGTDLVIEHIEKYWCPTITSDDILGGMPFRFTDVFSVSPGRRQLFLDDDCIAGISNLTRTMHQPAKKGAVIRPAASSTSGIQTRSAPAWDQQRKIWKLWDCTTPDDLHATHVYCGGYYESADGLHWTRPPVGQVEHKGSRDNNYVFVRGRDGKALRPDCVVYDAADPDPSRRFKAAIPPAGFAVSPDGIRWTMLDVAGVSSSDEYNLSLDGQDHVFILTVKRGGPGGRAVYLCTSHDFEQWTDLGMIFHADELDQKLGRENIAARFADATLQPPGPDDPNAYHVDVYNMGIFRYEGLYIGIPAMYHATAPIPNYPNTTGFHLLELTCSRDLRTWKRLGDRKAFIGPSRLGSGAYDLTQILPPSAAIMRSGSQSFSGRDELWFYYTGLKYRDTLCPSGKPV